MSFVSYEFLCLLAIVLVACWSLPHRLLNVTLLIASYVFYGWWDWRFLSLLFLSSVVDFTCGRLLDGRVPENRRSDVLIVSLVANLGLLLTFKYFDFFVGSFCDAVSILGVDIDPPLIEVVLPVGISFYTFQTLSYTIDVYRRKLTPTSQLLDFMLYVSFFPQLVAGPIERATNLLPQILKPRTRDWSMITSGAQLALVGFFKKMVIADNLATVINAVYGDTNSNGAAVVLATYAFAIQIYCDFSGYTDIARGVARMMGFHLCLNFNLPYFATNPSDFWRRWHISLSTWFRDYLYIPLGGNRTYPLVALRNLFVTMFLAGLWHGASWNFVLWGIYHGLLLVGFALLGYAKPTPAESNTNNEKRNGPGFWLKAIGFFQLTCIGWFIFRVESLNALVVLAANMLTFWNWDLHDVDVNLVFRLILFGIPLIAFQCYQFLGNDHEPWRRWPLLVRVAFYLILFYGIVLLGAPDRYEFIYFQF